MKHIPLEIVRTINGLSIQAVKIEDCLNMTKFFYAQNRLMLTDNHNIEICSLDILDMMKSMQERNDEINDYLVSRQENIDNS